MNGNASEVYAKNLQIIRLSDSRALLKRGVYELLLESTGIGSTLESLVALLDGTRRREEVVNAFPAPRREEIENLLAVLVQRRMISEEPEPVAKGAQPDTLQSAFYWNFGPAAAEVPARLRAAKVLVVGDNLISRSLVRGILETGHGEVGLVSHPVLDNHITSFDTAAGLGARRPGGSPAEGHDGRFRRLPGLPSDGELKGVSLLCATSDLGEADALLEVNRLALRLGKPFLPVWLHDLVGYVGPLNFPYETACFQCYRLRLDSNDDRYDVARALRKHVAADPVMTEGAGLLPPMAGVLGEIAAMEVTKCLGQFVPLDAVAAVVEINLVSFGSSLRRVLKIPRCPECSDTLRLAPKTLTRGPQIPHKE